MIEANRAMLERAIETSLGSQNPHNAPQPFDRFVIQLVGTFRERVARCPIQPVLVRHHLRAHELAVEAAGPEPSLRRVRIGLAEALRQIGHHRHGTHGFGATRDDEVLLAAHYRHGREMDGLLGRTALSIDRCAGHTRRQRGGKHHVAPEIGCLRANLANAAEDHIVDQRRVEVAARDPLHQAIDARRPELGWVHLRNAPVALAGRGPQRADR